MRSSAKKVNQTHLRTRQTKRLASANRPQPRMSIPLGGRGGGGCALNESLSSSTVRRHAGNGNSSCCCCWCVALVALASGWRGGGEWHVDGRGGRAGGEWCVGRGASLVGMRARMGMGDEGYLDVCAGRSTQSRASPTSEDGSPGSPGNIPYSVRVSSVFQWAPTTTGHSTGYERDLVRARLTPTKGLQMTAARGSS